MHDVDLAGLVEAAQAGNAKAQNEIADYFLPRAVSEAKKSLQNISSPMVDHDDIANSALKSIYLRIKDKRLRFEGEKELGAFLKTVVERKARKYWRLETTQKRGKGKTIQENQIDTNDNSGAGASLEQYPGGQRASMDLNDKPISVKASEKQIVDAVLSSLQHDLIGLFKELFNKLDDKPRKALLLLLSKDYSNKELAKELGCAIASVERYRAAIRRKLDGLSDVS